MDSLTQGHVIQTQACITHVMRKGMPQIQCRLQHRCPGLRRCRVENQPRKKRNTAKLREQMGLKKDANLRDHQSMLAVSYEQLAEILSATDDEAIEGNPHALDDKTPYAHIAPRISGASFVAESTASKRPAPWRTRATRSKVVERSSVRSSASCPSEAFRKSK